MNLAGSITDSQDRKFGIHTFCSEFPLRRFRFMARTVSLFFLFVSVWISERQRIWHEKWPAIRENDQCLHFAVKGSFPPWKKSREQAVLGEIELCLQTGPKKERTILKPITLDLILNLGSKCTRCPKRRSRQIIYRSSSVFLYGTRICGVWGTKIAIALSSRSALCIFLMQW